ncbi:MAG: ROK family protein [Verrucomicrobia bacterium]|nr:ROK family protein [Verrucomicrobiota bacterium]
MKKAISAPLDPGFQPPALVNHQYLATATERLIIALEGERGRVTRYETKVRPSPDDETLRYVERTVKFMLWARGGWRLYLGGPSAVCKRIKVRKFDADLMSTAYGKKFQTIVTTPVKVPAEKEIQLSAGGHLKGCRIGFDLGASDYKVSAVIDGEAIFTEEMPWDPKTQSNPEYHYHHIASALHRAAAHLPRVDAIGGSSAGLIVNNEIRAASLLRAVPKKLFPQAAGIFKRIAKEWRVPILVMNDGDVTALAGTLSLGDKGMLGIAMGSSQAAGFINKKGRILGWLNELAFVPVDYNPDAAMDEWSGDRGVGAQYFSQQAVNKLLPAAGIAVPKEMGLPERLKEVQALMAKDDPRAAKIYETIGVYLGYSIPHYADFYDFDHMLILGRVTTGKGGDILIAKAREVLQTEFPEIAAKIQLHVPDEKSRRVGQAVAAASLPEIKR